jgi:hypothetical protein
MPFFSLLKTVSPPLYDQYMLERFAEKRGETEKKDNPFIKEKIQITSNEPLKLLKKVSNLPPDHPAKKYIVSRQIPTPFHAELFWAPKFRAWVNEILPGKIDGKHEEDRLIIPLLDENNEMFGFQGRSLNPKSKLRYISIMMNEKMPKLWGLHKVNTNLRFYVFEGPIDAMFISNSIASCGGKLITDLGAVKGNLDNATIVYDNQPRNKEVVDAMLTAVSKGFKICVWPSSEKSKDINDMITARVPPAEYVKTEQVKNASIVIKKIIDSHTYSGMEAELRIAEWRKA